MQTLFITGTSTDLGKTLLIKILTIYKQTYHDKESLGVLNLTQKKEYENNSFDKLFINLNNNIKIINLQLSHISNIINTVDLSSIILSRLWQSLTSLQKEKDLILIKGVGALSSPITRELSMSYIAGVWHLKTILIIPVGLETIHQAVTNIALAIKDEVNLKGIILNCMSPVAQEKVANLAPINLIESLTQVSVLGVLPYIKNTEDNKQLLDAASNLDLELLFC